MVFVQKSNFFLFVFFGEIKLENIVFYILDKKEWFLDQKIEVLKGSRNRHFPCFLSKNRFFFLIKLWQKRSFFVFWIKRMIFWPEIEVSKNPKSPHFPKGIIHGFWSKIKRFVIFLGGRKQLSKDLFLIFWIEKIIFRPENWRCKKCQKRHFPKGLDHFVDLLDKKEWFLDQKIEVP